MRSEPLTRRRLLLATGPALALAHGAGLASAPGTVEAAAAGRGCACAQEPGALRVVGWAARRVPPERSAGRPRSDLGSRA